MMKRQLGLLALSLSLASVATATTLIAMDVPALTRGSDLVVRGVVTQVSSRWTDDGKRIMTDTELAIDEVLKGTQASKRVVVMQPGGVVGDVGQLVHGVATFAVGQEVVVFLERRGDRTFVVGLAQGRFVIDRSGPEPMVQGGEDELYLVDAKTHAPVEAPRAPMTLASLVTLVRQNLGPSPQDPARPLTPKVKTP